MALTALSGSLSSASVSRSKAVLISSLTRRGSTTVTVCAVNAKPSPRSSIDSVTG
jgi:hypothetical protein